MISLKRLFASSIELDRDRTVELRPQIDLARARAADPARPTANARTIDEARARHGKPFAHETRLRRKARASSRLRRLNALSAQAQAPALAVIRSNRKGGSANREQAPAQRVRPVESAASRRHDAAEYMTGRKEAAS